MDELVQWHTCGRFICQSYVHFSLCFRHNGGRRPHISGRFYKLLWVIMGDRYTNRKTRSHDQHYTFFFNGLCRRHSDPDGHNRQRHGHLHDSVAERHDLNWPVDEHQRPNRHNLQCSDSNGRHGLLPRDLHLHGQRLRCGCVQRGNGSGNS